GLLGRPMGQQQPSRTGRGRDLARLLRSEVAVRFALRLVQRCLAEEDVGIAGELDQRRRRAGVARVREHGAVVLDAQPVRRFVVVRNGTGVTVRPAALNGLASAYSCTSKTSRKRPSGANVEM